MNATTKAGVLLGSALLVFCPASQDLPRFKLIYQADSWPALSYSYYQQMHPARLYDGTRECLVARDSDGFQVMEFLDSSWRVTHQIPFKWPRTADTSAAWTTGDIDDDRQDEIVAFRGRSIVIFRWGGARFADSRYEFPYFVDDAIVGDVNNDGRNELVVLGYEKMPIDPSGCLYSLCVARLRDQRVDIIFNDSGKFGFGTWPAAVPPDWLVCIADLAGDGTNRLVAAKEQSDVSPTDYRRLDWISDGLQLVDSFHLDDRRVYQGEGDTVRGGTRFYVWNQLVPVEVGDQPMLVANARGQFEGHVLLRIRRREVTVVDTLFRDEGWCSPNHVLWVNIDGKGKGLLQIIQGMGYRFYRAESEP